MACSEPIAVATTQAAVRETTQVVIENFGSCNMRCTYCFPEHMWQREGRHGAMAEATYRGILERVFSTASSDTIEVHLAGGEPLLAGQLWLEMAFRVAKEIASRYGKQATFSLQTNATLLTTELAQCLVDNEVNVGVSLDGTERINEAVRGHTGETVAGFGLLSDTAGRRPGVIVTVTRSNARHMREVVDYLETLGVALFRANQMGATASWNVDAAPRAEEWLVARQDLFDEIAARRGRIMEVNVSSAVCKLIGTLLYEVSPLGSEHSCCAMRCPAGRQLMYFDQSGSAYPCPRANVTPAARIAHWTDDDFDDRWDEVIRGLDDAMAVPPQCRQCPAQLVCDYGCHAFNVAQGNFFEVNCDSTKDFFRWVTDRLEDVARIDFLFRWRQGLLGVDPEARRRAIAEGIDPPHDYVEGLADQLRRCLDERLCQPDLVPAILDQRYGWRDEHVPFAILGKARVPTISGTKRSRERR